jgi:hypothetical protein
LNDVLPIQIVGVKNQPLPACIENPAVGLGCFSIARNIVNFRELQIARSDQLLDVLVMLKQIPVLCDLIFLLFEFTFAITDDLYQLSDLRLHGRSGRRNLIPLPCYCVDTGRSCHSIKFALCLRQRTVRYP